MATDSESGNGSDPFSDHAAILDGDSERDAIAESTLRVGRNAALTLGTVAVIVLDEGAERRSRLTCCGLLPEKSTKTLSIPYFNVLWAEVGKGDLTIHYAKPLSKSPQSSVRVAYLHYILDGSTAAVVKASNWVDRLLDRAYGPSQRNKRIKVLINPFGGKGKAAKLYIHEIEPIFAAARCEVDAESTKYSGHAVEIAAALDINAYDVIASASGDGLPHECINGLAKKPNAAEALRKVAVVQLPCGSGNAMSWNLNGTANCSLAALNIVKGVRTPLDLVSVTQGHSRTLSFLSQSLGVVAESDLGTDNLRWMGDARFYVGFLVRLLGKTQYPCDIAVKMEISTKQDIKRHYAQQVTRMERTPQILESGRDQASDDTTWQGLPPLKYGTVLDPLPTDAGWTPLIHYPHLGNFYCGNMTFMAEDAPFFPASLPTDGLLDFVTVPGNISRLKAINLLFSVPQGTFFDQDSVNVSKVSAMRVVPRYGRRAEKHAREQGQSRLGQVLNGGNAARDEGYFSVDGEKMPFEPFQIEVHRALGTVLSRRPGIYEYSGPKGWEDFLDRVADELDHANVTASGNSHANTESVGTAGSAA